MAPRPPLRLFWWRKRRNFGDGLSPHLVAYASGRQVVWAEPGEAEVFALGSILRTVAQTYRVPRGHRPIIWGSGAMRPVGRRFTEHVEFAALRGPKTAEVLHVTVEAFGDPGLLVAHLVDDHMKNDGQVAIVPHFSQFDQPVFEDLAARADVRLVDVRGEDPLEVVRQIATARHVFSSSLHGLVTADAFGVPSTWMDPVGIHAEPHFKFTDYALAIERDLGVPVPPQDVAGRLDTLHEGPLPHAAGIVAAQARLRDSFPPEMRAH